jgi:hypothetical protein
MAGQGLITLNKFGERASIGFWIISEPHDLADYLRQHGYFYRVLLYAFGDYVDK